MDGLLINSEDVITLSINQLLEKYQRPPFTQSIRAQLMGVPNSTNGDLFHNWAKLPISREQFARESSEQMRLDFPKCEPLPGAEKLLEDLSNACNASGDRIELALASGTKTNSYELKTSRPETKRLLSFFRSERRILGDDPRVKGRGKPAPDIYLVALQSLNSTADPNENEIKPNECLVFEDSLVGVEAARRAGMRVIWVPHPDVGAECQANEKEMLTGGAGMIKLESLEHFDYMNYGIYLSP
ncbi:HAD-like domain-containing protein [Annulohypoxylon maeteangense]|uniref:HAD-like domain-containing protein n=1 Tax=Annulohypoxylon maeteangense TaxID=1927788 RepID=UPI00200730B9|nr:HAD-like domain-containing protein [Annulohypoxylon maeteangense]KAI0886158.1 HAD-like domain-containing protein [Annulohypoxylon maeteangense]